MCFFGDVPLQKRRVSIRLQKSAQSSTSLVTSNWISRTCLSPRTWRKGLASYISQKGRSCHVYIKKVLLDLSSKDKQYSGFRVDGINPYLVETMWSQKLCPEFMWPNCRRKHIDLVSLLLGFCLSYSYKNLFMLNVPNYPIIKSPYIQKITFMRFMASTDFGVHPEKYTAATHTHPVPQEMRTELSPRSCPWWW